MEWRIVFEDDGTWVLEGPSRWYGFFTPDYRYCPFCGAELKEPALDMIQRWLEQGWAMPACGYERRWHRRKGGGA